MTVEELKATLLTMVEEVEGITTSSVKMCNCTVEDTLPCTCYLNGVKMEISIVKK